MYKLEKACILFCIFVRERYNKRKDKKGMNEMARKSIPYDTFPIAKIRIGYDCQIFEENIKSFVTNQITLLKAKCEYKHLPLAMKKANCVLDSSNVNNTNINTDTDYLRTREGLAR